MKQVFSNAFSTLVLTCSILAGVGYVQTAMAAEEGRPDITRGEQLYMQGDPARGLLPCIACHGPGANSVLAMYPHLAGQPYNYIIEQIKNFQAAPGQTQPNRLDVSGAFTAMAPVAMAITAQDAKDLAAYINKQELVNPAAAKMAANLDVVLQGRDIWRSGIPDRGVPACASCHGANGHGMPALYPRLSGQHPEYIESQLLAFADGHRKNGGPENQMGTIANRMSREQIKAVADYAAGIR